MIGWLNGDSTRFQAGRIVRADQADQADQVLAGGTDYFVVIGGESSEAVGSGRPRSSVRRRVRCVWLASSRRSASALKNVTIRLRLDATTT